MGVHKGVHNLHLLFGIAKKLCYSNCKQTRLFGYNLLDLTAFGYSKNLQNRHFSSKKRIKTHKKLAKTVSFCGSCENRQLQNVTPLIIKQLDR